MGFEVGVAWEQLESVVTQSLFGALQGGQVAAPVQVLTQTSLFLVVRVGGRRYAIPGAGLLAVGAVRSKDWIQGSVVHAQGRCRLRDLKAVLGLEGEPGFAYFVYSEGERAVAWVVDGIEEDFLAIDSEKLKRGTSHSRRGLISGVLPGLRPISVLSAAGLLRA